ncbi:hypothetical protein F2Q70_00024847 [Brassica cretica]|uniref:Uncharacterized protein n=1 Tax=Brassica cretica TaxID=69181 RepID=A0A8S9LIC9_BRACR|nr:hypothetical protein F2Q70_00024847 [Brassica cretica]
MVGVAEDLFLDEQETAATGFLSFLGNSAASKRLRSTAWGFKEKWTNKGLLKLAAARSV